MRFAAALLVLATAPAAWAAAPRGVLGSKHDLSVTGPGPIRALSEPNPCAFCHLPHVGGTTSRPDVGPVHVPYESSTLRGRPGRPTGATRVCLSCHDGTIAVGQTLGRRIKTSLMAIPSGRPSNLGTDLRKSHPVSFTPGPARGETHSPPPGDAVRLDRAGEIQCTSCHDPHREFDGDPVMGKFLVKPARGSELCLSCHEAGFVSPPTGSHASAAATFGAAQGNGLGFDSVAQAGCRACHRPHGADPSGRLLDKAPREDEALCLRCHSGLVARANVGADWSKQFAHSRNEQGVHDAAEGRPGARRSLPESSPGAPRHATCADCHEPHQARRDRPLGAPAIGGALAGVWGVDLSGQRVEPARFEYEVCLKCHGDSANKPQPAGGPRGDSVPRASGDANLRLQLAPSAPSSHAIASPGRSADVPGLKAPYSTRSMIFCSDCHASDSGPGAGGAGARGPHGSIHPFLLERSYTTRDGSVEGPAAYALCYKCHDRDVLLSSKSGFPLHRRHVVEQGSPCSACHASHGVSSERGTPEENAHLIDFDVSIVQARSGVRRYRSAGPLHGSCDLTCHGKPHDPWTY
jgi:predicted CXXCH cytochrome family protein